MSQPRMNDIFTSILQEIITPSANPNVNRNSRTIPVDVVNLDDRIDIYAELPGIETKMIDVDFYNNKITIVAEKQSPYETSSNTMHTKELFYGHFERTITIPICVTKPETVSVNFQNGVLHVRINKLIEEANRFSVKPPEVPP